MCSLVVHLRPYLEFIPHVSGAVIALAAILGLKQLRLMKADTELRSERAAKEKAIEAANQYLDEYVALDGAFDDACREAGVDSYSGPIGDFTIQSIPSAWLPELEKRLEISFLSGLNKLEGIAAAFVSGVADERTGFEIIGRSFCGAVEYNYDLIAVARYHDATPYRNNIVELYRLWSPRLPQSDLDAAKATIERHRSGKNSSE